jgi:hypothetical protein
VPALSLHRLAIRICKRSLNSAVIAFIQPDYYVISYVVPFVISEVTDHHLASYDGFASTTDVKLYSPQNWGPVHRHFP